MLRFADRYGMIGASRKNPGKMYEKQEEHFNKNVAEEKDLLNAVTPATSL